MIPSVVHIYGNRDSYGAFSVPRFIQAAGGRGHGNTIGDDRVDIGRDQSDDRTAEREPLTHVQFGQISLVRSLLLSYIFKLNQPQRRVD